MSFQNSRNASRYNKKQTKIDQFLQEMNKVIPWEELEKAVDKIRIKAHTWRPPIKTIVLIKMYCLQQRYDLSDPALEDKIYDSLAFQKFLDIDLSVDQIADDTTICRFRKLLTDNNLQQQFFEIINKKLEDKGLFVKSGTIIDASIIESPMSTKNKEKKRDEEMSFTKKRDKLHFWCKAHIWTDKNWLVHSLDFTTAKVHDSQVIDSLLNWEEKELYADSWYANKKKEKELEKKWIIPYFCRRAYRNKPLTAEDKLRNKICSHTRSKVERVFWVIKDKWWHRKVRYKWLKKNYMQWYFLCGLTNIYRMRNCFLS